MIFHQFYDHEQFSMFDRHTEKLVATKYVVRYLIRDLREQIRSGGWMDFHQWLRETFDKIELRPLPGRLREFDILSIRAIKKEEAKCYSLESVSMRAIKRGITDDKGIDGDDILTIDNIF